MKAIDDDLAEHLHLEANMCGITFVQAYNEEMAAVNELAKIAHLAADITPCQPPQTWYDEDWSSFRDFHESIKKAGCA